MDAPTPDRKQRRITARLVRRGEEEYEFDAEFWREQGPAKRLEALWDMVLEAEAWSGAKPRELGGKGKTVAQPRLQRSVLRIERR